jgi:hypothetical protein
VEAGDSIVTRGVSRPVDFIDTRAGCPFHTKDHLPSLELNAFHTTEPTKLIVTFGLKAINSL